MSDFTSHRFTSTPPTNSCLGTNDMHTSHFDFNINTSSHLLGPLGDYATYNNLRHLDIGGPDRQLARSSYKLEQDSTAQLRLEESLTRVCLLALENDRLHVQSKRLKAKITELETDFQTSKVRDSQFSTDSSSQMKSELMAKENVTLKELLDKQGRETDSWRQKYLDMQAQVSRFERKEEELSKLKLAYSNLETQFDDMFGERESLVHEIQRHSDIDKV